MSDSRKCVTCGGPVEDGYIATTNGSGILWSAEALSTRLRPYGLEVLAPTGFSGSYSANLPGLRCRSCATILVRLVPPK
jgi:hypothetical protein